MGRFRMDAFAFRGFEGSCLLGRTCWGSCFEGSEGRHMAALDLVSASADKQTLQFSRL